ncbi:hypothetical protein D3C76_1346130 [compost metagenome]
MRERGYLTVGPNLCSSSVPIPSDRGRCDGVDGRIVEKLAQLLDLGKIVALRARCFLRDHVANIAVKDPLHSPQVQWYFLGFELRPLEPGFVEILAQWDRLEGRPLPIWCNGARADRDTGR